ncbi:MAG TPA: WD40 repeat domain-containing protein [Methylocystis sp.]|nr:WD40 repeat domain-containing protein [Methylocystis sp.]HXZ14671.1 WD40 repeat domain-containing protein [Roseiarcus sp.]
MQSNVTDDSSLLSHVAPIAAEEAVTAAAFVNGAPAFAFAHGVVLFPETGARVVAHGDGALLCAASDGRRFVTGGDDGRLVATFASGETRELANEDGRWIDAVALRDNGALAWTAGRVARARDGAGETKSLDLPSTSRGLAFLPKGYRLALAHYNGVTLWYPNATAKPELLEWKGSHLDLIVSPDGRYVLTSMQENTLHGWRLADGQNMRMAGYPGKTRSLSFSGDGDWLATSGADACILWPFSGKNGPMGAAPRECGVRAGVRVTRVAFHPTALVVAVGYEDGMTLLCRILDGAELLVSRPGAGTRAKISALAWDAAGARLAFGAENGEGGVLTLPKR